jgi:hypothetical protein
MGEGSSSAAHEAADMTRRMICGGVAGMMAKVSLKSEIISSLLQMLVVV